MSEPPVWGGAPEPGGAPDPVPGDGAGSRTAGRGGGRHAAHRAPRRSLREQVQGRYVLLGAAVLALVVVATVLFGACSSDDDPVAGPGTVIPPSPTPTGAPSTSESVVSDPTTRATTTTPTPTVTATKGDAKAGDKKAGDKKKKAKAVKAPVLVLNNSRITGLAARWAARIEAEGWDVTRTDNWTRSNLSEPTLFYAPGRKAAAETFAKEFDVVKDVRPAVSGMGPDLTLVLTSSAA